MQPDRCLEIHLTPEMFKIFFPLLQEGVGVEVESGCSIRELLTEQFRIASDYVDGRITTIFLNYRAVDNISTALVPDGALLTLSGAMPGLVGATMRSGGYYAAMRGGMTYCNEGEISSPKQGMITLKLFNLLLGELGPRVLLRGIRLTTDRWNDFLKQQPEALRPLKYRIDGRPAPVDRFRCVGEFPGGEMLRIKVHCGDE